MLARKVIGFVCVANRTDKTKSISHHVVLWPFSVNFNCIDITKTHQDSVYQSGNKIYILVVGWVDFVQDNYACIKPCDASVDKEARYLFRQ